MDNHIDPEAVPKRGGMRAWFEEGRVALCAETQGRHVPGRYVDDVWVTSHRVSDVPEGQRRPWHLMLQNKPMHQAVLDVLDADWEPLDWHKLLLEWPTLSSDLRLAYTRDERTGAAGGARTVTTAGRYITRHWPRLPADYVRDVVARNTASVSLWHTGDGIVRAAQEGPTSCMTWASRCCDTHHHPYRVYAPKYGWRAAVRMEGDVIAGRALVLMASRADHVEGETLDGATFVRTYRRAADRDGCSYADEALCAWLEQQGASKEDGWEDGALLAKITMHDRGPHGGEFLAPYLDGNNQKVDDRGDYLVIDADGSYECDSTSGGPTTLNQRECGHCNDSCDGDDGTYVGYDEELWVGGCCSDEYTEVRGRNSRRYYIVGDNAVEVNDRWYDPDYLGDNDIVVLEDGEYASRDDAFECPVSGSLYLNEEGVDTEDNGRCLAENTWTCTATGLVYSDDQDYAEDEAGLWVHPDELMSDEDKQDAVEVVDPLELFAGCPPSDGWWNVMYADPHKGDSYLDEWNRVENGRFTHRVLGSGAAGTPYGSPAEWAAILSLSLQVGAVGGDYRIWHRRRHPAWAARVEALINPPPHKWQVCIDAQNAGQAVQLRAFGGPWADAACRLNFGDERTEYRVKPQREYTHPNVSAAVRYRAGTRGRIDVWGLGSNAGCWSLNAGGRSADLTDGSGYTPVEGFIEDRTAPVAWVSVSDCSFTSAIAHSNSFTTETT